MTLVGVFSLGERSCQFVASHVAALEIKNMIVLYKQGKVEEAFTCIFVIFSFKYYLFQLIRYQLSRTESDGCHWRSSASSLSNGKRKRR
jgi:hypothetical protein